MRGVKRRAAAVSAAEKLQPVVNDGILDVAGKKIVRCCVECGATSTPQWREGPMGPKTLCNACGVRRQRMLRKQQVISLGTVPTAPVVAAQARRRLPSRADVAPAPLVTDDDFHLVGAGSGSEHSSDETELDWAAHQAPAPARPDTRSLASALPQPQQPHPPHSDPVQHHPARELDDSCNEEESAAYDLLFFAGVGCSAGSGGSAVTGPEGEYLEERPQEEDYDGILRRSWQQFNQQQDQHILHRHNTRRHAHPVRRSEDFYYYDGEEASIRDEVSGDGHLRASGVGGSIKRRRVVASPAVLRMQSRMTPREMSVSASEEAAESMPGTMTTLSTRPGRPGGILPSPLPRSHLNTFCSDPPAAPAACSSGAPALDSFTTDPRAGGHAAPSVSSPSAPAPAIPAPSPSAPAPAAAPPAVSLPPLSLPPLAPLYPGPVALPVLPLSVSLPEMSAKDLEVIAKLQWEFQRACLQLQHANAACDAVGAVVAERREAASSAHDAAVAASQQLADGVLSVADQYKLRDVLAELRSATAVAAPASAASAWHGGVAASASPAVAAVEGSKQ